MLPALIVTSQLAATPTPLGLGLEGLPPSFPVNWLAASVEGHDRIMHPQPVSERMRPFLDLPLFHDSDANTCCWGELVASRAPPPNFMFILGEWRRSPARASALITGIGVGLVLNGLVHHGRGSSCEVAFSSYGSFAVAFGAAGLFLVRAFGDPGALSSLGLESGVPLLMQA